MPTVLHRILFSHLTVVLLLLGACAAPPPVSKGQRSDQWQRHRQQLVTVSQWELRGRIAVRAENNGWTASLHWKQDSEHYQIRLIAPFGRGIYDLRGDGDSVQLRTADGRLLFAQDAPSLLQQQLGWQLPVNDLVYWVRGLPAPGNTAETMTLDEDGRLDDLQQDGWQVHYDGYSRHDGGIFLPERLVIQGRKLRLQLVIHTWGI